MKLKFNFLRKPTLLSMAVLSINTFAQEDASNSQVVSKDTHFEKIVITGTRTPKLLSNSPVKVDVISKDEIQLLSQSTIAQALNFIPGVVVVRNQKDGYNIQMQGFDGDNVLVLLNSQPLISPTGSSVDLDQISAQNIEQIEVIRGAASVMYGSSAMGGVINIITKETDENQVQFSYEIGSYNTNAIEDDKLSHQVKLNTSYIYEDWASHLNVLINNTPGFDYDNDKSSSVAGSLDKTFINMGTSTKINRANLRVNYQYLDEEKGKNIGLIAGQTGFARYTAKVAQHQVDLHFGKDVFNKADHEIANNSWQMNSRFMDHNETSGNSASLRTANIGLYEVNGQYVFSQNDLEIVSGGLVHQDTLEQYKVADGSVEVPQVSKESVEAFSQVNWIKPNYQLLMGMRVQNDSDFGNHYALRASGMLYLIGDNNTQLHDANERKLQWRIGIGQGYRVPTLKERFYEFDHSALGYKVYGNVDLAPEESVSFNSSLNYQTSVKNFWLGDFDSVSDINVHFTQAKNLINTFHDSERSAEENLDISIYGNVEQADIKGVDLSTELTFSNWVSQFNYSYLNAKNHKNVRLENRPTHQIKASVGYNKDEWELDSMLYLVYQKDEAVPKSEFEQVTLNNSWTTVDLKISQQVTRNFSWRFNIENIFDVHLANDANTNGLFDARPASSRFVSLGIQYQL